MIIIWRATEEDTPRQPPASKRKHTGAQTQTYAYSYHTQEKKRINKR